MERGEEIARRDSAGMGAARAFELVRRELAGELNDGFYQSYVEPMRLVAEWNGALLFRAGSQIAKERLREQVLPRLEARLRVYEPSAGPVEILLDDEIPAEVRSLTEARIEEARAEAARKPGAQAQTFENFCVDASNHRAVTVAQMIAAGAGAPFPILLIHSTPGCGKSHVLSAIAHAALEANPRRNVLMMTGQEFLETFQTALHKKRDSSAFKEMVRAPDLLFIDDFHRICGKKATEEEAFDTMYDVTRRGGHVVLAAKLRRTASSEIDPPEAPLRRPILDMRVRNHAQNMPGFSVAPDALDMIAERMHVTGRELDGAVCQLLIEWKTSGGTEVTLEAAANALQTKLSESAERRITVNLVQKVVARHYNMAVPQLLERTRRQAVARPRQVAMHLACQLTHASLPDIGQRFGGFDHTTIMYARDRIASLRSDDPAFNAEVEGIARAIRREP